jgi:hypothetical protein
MKKAIWAYGQEHNFPKVRLSDGFIVPLGEAWRGFIKYQMHKHQRAYEDITSGNVKILEVQT